MPTYVYRREDGSTFEIEQRISDDALTECPTTGQQVTRVISGGTGLIFKGSGFYLTDYARSGANGKSDDAKSSAKPEAAKEAKEPKSENTPQSTKSKDTSTD